MKDGVEQKTICDLILLRIVRNHENAHANASQELNHDVNAMFVQITCFMHGFLYSVVNNISSAYPYITSNNSDMKQNCELQKTFSIQCIIFSNKLCSNKETSLSEEYIFKVRRLLGRNVDVANSFCVMEGRVEGSWLGDELGA